jgi:hypothetical protein
MRVGLGRKETLLTPWVSILPTCPWIRCQMVLRMKIHFHRVIKGKRLKIKGRREMLNLKSSINYGDASVPFRSRKGKAQVL